MKVWILVAFRIQRKIEKNGNLKNNHVTVRLVNTNHVITLQVCYRIG